MRNYCLNIAGYKIRLETSDLGPDLIPSARFRRFLNIAPENSTIDDLIIKVHSGTKDLPEGSRRIFHAPFTEEINGERINHQFEFWSIWKHDSDLFFKVVFPLAVPAKKATVKFSLKERYWDMWFEGSNNPADPLEYPLDGLILYYLTVIQKDIMIHASGIFHEGRGYIFSGVSGKGKTTIAGLWNNFGAQLIHDDRLILRKSQDGYTMYNTPVYEDEEPFQAPLNRIYIIEHGTVNRTIPLSGANAVSAVISNCIQHNWGTEIVSGLLGSVSDLCGKVDVAKLVFKPDQSVIEHILENE
jgi:hypothetical protein